jgi:hypothetical protein
MGRAGSGRSSSAARPRAPTSSTTATFSSPASAKEARSTEPA